jgi:hypothetical protein
MITHQSNRREVKESKCLHPITTSPTRFSGNLHQMARNCLLALDLNAVFSGTLQSEYDAVEEARCDEQDEDADSDADSDAGTEGEGVDGDGDGDGDEDDAVSNASPSSLLLSAAEWNTSRLACGVMAGADEVTSNLEGECKLKCTA